ncbi:S-adenosyl-L-methionine-dependent methyltransferase [Byssothecium circinans]|uniref:S-adenosyl-L-methionine-dependent methyltransferase n=1 Tax=Byssothecium circinans TaxID=147558 RepID=A0A6A5U8T1_9PLEO|nr:S-adenosyl-L-methionine-dependent methyltransferase [Byssothecium circinans]
MPDCVSCAAEKRIPNLLAGFDEEGVSVEKLAQEAGCDAAKLSRIMRCLCSIHIFKEVQPDRFANNRVSAALPSHGYGYGADMPQNAFDIYTASDYLPRSLFDKETGPSYDVAQTAFQAAVGTQKPRWDWLEERVTVKDLREGRCGTDGGLSAYPGPFGSELEKAVDGKADDELLTRPELPIFGLAMVGGDYPWGSLGSALVVDVGGDVDGFSLQLSQLHQQLKFIIQDREAMLQQAETVVWPKDNPDAIAQKRVEFCPHDFFQPNPVKNADVYWLRYVMHDWSDDFCVRILAAIKPSMGRNSRILIRDQVMNTTLGSEELAAAPAPLPANWGYYTRYSHQRDLVMMALLNGIERTPREFRGIIEKAGLKLHKIWDCRSQVSLVEVVLPDAAVA